MDKVSSRSERLDKTSQKKAKRAQLALQLLKKCIDTKSDVLDKYNSVYHNVRSVIRGLKDRAISDIVKTKYADDFVDRYNKVHNEEIQLKQKKNRKKAKIDLHRLQEKYEYEDRDGISYI